MACVSDVAMYRELRKDSEERISIDDEYKLSRHQYCFHLQGRQEATQATSKM
jgi:hypothetical protein